MSIFTDQDFAMSKAIEKVERWRKREIDKEFYCSRTTPASSLRIVGLFKHAAEVYIATLFRDFEEEFKMAISCLWLKSCKTMGRMYISKCKLLFFFIIGVIIILFGIIICYNW